MKKLNVIFGRILLGALVISLSFNAPAGPTRVGEPASQSFVRSSDHRKVILFVGDSRTMMCTYPGGSPPARSNYCFCWVNGGNINVIGKDGSLTPYVERMIRKYRRRCAVALNLGVNGNSNPKSNARRIIKIYRWWMKRYPDVRFYVVSVNPTILNSGSYSNGNVISVNKVLRKQFEPEGIYIDTYTMLMESGLVTGSAPGMRDNYHYEWSVGKRILKYVRRFVTKADQNQEQNQNQELNPESGAGSLSEEGS